MSKIRREAESCIHSYGDNALACRRKHVTQAKRVLLLLDALESLHESDFVPDWRKQDIRECIKQAEEL